MNDTRAGWAADVRALMSLRRALPIVAVMAALVVAELLSGYGWRAAWVSLLMTLAFTLFAPAWWCRCFALASSAMPRGHDTPKAPAGSPNPAGPPEPAGSAESAAKKSASHAALRGFAYVAGCLLVVAAAGMSLPPLFGARASLLTDAAGWPVSTVLFAVGGWGLGRDIQLARSLARERQRGDRLAREVEHARLLAIRHQLDPHFLFNTLNAIAEWCVQDPEVAEAATLKLAAMLRAMLEALERDRWPLRDELELIEQLFELHRIRDPEQLSYAIEGAADIDAQIPTLLLLPLAENAMTHGPRAGHRGHVIVRVRHDERAAAVHISIDNPGPYNGPREGGHGLESVRRRLSLSYAQAAHPAPAELRIGPTPEDPARTLTELRLPL